MVRAFEDALRKDRSSSMVRKVRASLGSILTEAQERGLVAQNVVHALRIRRHGRDGASKLATANSRSASTSPPRRGTRPHPTPKGALATAVPHRHLHRPTRIRVTRPALDDVDLKRGELHVRQRADRYNRWAPQVRGCERTVPMPPMLINALRGSLTCPIGEHGLVFPNDSAGSRRSKIVRRGLQPTMVAAGIVDRNGRAKYTGMHAFRHFYASWCINRRVDGGLELPLKVVQARLGHASIQMTADSYGHLFPRGDDGAELAAAEHAFLRG